MHDLPAEGRDAIHRVFGHSEHQLWKAERDAETLYRRYGLPPDKWNCLEFRRMAKDNRSAPSTEAHRWAILKRVIDSFRATSSRTNEEGLGGGCRPET